MVEVFFCSAPQSEERLELATKMLAIWKQMNGIEVRLLTPRILGCTDWAFQKLRRCCAEAMAKTPIYALVDDDIELTEGKMEMAIEILKRHPQFGMLSVMPVNATINRWTPEDYDAFHDMQVTEHHSVGGLRIVRRGSMFKGWPEQTARSYDLEHCQQLRECGYRVGYYYDIKMHHHGEHKSETWRTNVQSISHR